MLTKAYSAILLLIGLISTSSYVYSEELEEPWLQPIKEKPRAHSEVMGINTERWILAGKDKLQRRLYVDSETINKGFSDNRNDSFSLIYTFWLKTAAFNGSTTPPKKATINCTARTFESSTSSFDPDATSTAEIVPESTEEVLYKYFCQSTEAKNTVFPKTARQVYQEALEEHNKQLAEWQKQNKAAQAIEAERVRQMQENAWKQADLNNRPSTPSMSGMLRSLFSAK